MERNYVILNFSELTDEIISQTLITNKDMLRKSSENKVIVGYEGNLPNSLSGKSSLSHEAVLTELKKDVWNPDD